MATEGPPRTSNVPQGCLVQPVPLGSTGPSMVLLPPVLGFTQGPISPGQGTTNPCPCYRMVGLGGELVEDRVWDPAARATLFRAPDSELNSASGPEPCQARPGFQRMRQREAFSSEDGLGLAASPLTPLCVTPISRSWCWALGRPCHRCCAPRPPAGFCPDASISDRL